MAARGSSVHAPSASSRIWTASSKNPSATSPRTCVSASPPRRNPLPIAKADVSLANQMGVSRSVHIPQSHVPPYPQRRHHPPHRFLRLRPIHGPGSRPANPDPPLRRAPLGQAAARHRQRHQVSQRSNRVSHSPSSPLPPSASLSMHKRGDIPRKKNNNKETTQLTSSPPQSRLPRVRPRLPRLPRPLLRHKRHQKQPDPSAPGLRSPPARRREPSRAKVQSHPGPDAG